MSYQSDRIFHLWAYTGSHSFLLLRSSKLDEDVEGFSNKKSFNIDIEFWGVAYLDLVDKLNGLTISEIRQNIPERFAQYSRSLGYKVFEIKSVGRVFYIIAAGCRAGKNDWENDDRIKNYHLEYDEILAAF